MWTTPTPKTTTTSISKKCYALNERKKEWKKAYNEQTFNTTQVSVTPIVLSVGERNFAESYSLGSPHGFEEKSNFHL